MQIVFIPRDFCLCNLSEVLGVETIHSNYYLTLLPFQQELLPFQQDCSPSNKDCSLCQIHITPIQITSPPLLVQHVGLWITLVLALEP